MRRPSPALRCLARLAATATVVALAGLTPAVEAHGTPAWQRVAYRGERFAVPASWPIDDLGTDPALCVRFDRHAVYEGASPATSSCPPGLAGVTEAIQVQPLDATGRAQAGPSLRAVRVAGQAAFVNTDQVVTQRLVAELPDAGVLVTISYGRDPAVARHILASFRETSGAGRRRAATRPVAGVPASPPATAGAVSVGPVTWQGEGFDACSAPSTSTMSAWRGDSPYRALGVYIGGINRACGDGYLSSTWVEAEVASGWDLIPIYVGLQASCADQPGLAPISSSAAGLEGTQAADDATVQARYLGIGVGSPIFFDMEAWNTTEASCTASVVAFVTAWDNELVHKGFVPGVYGSAGAGIGQALAPLYAATGLPRLVDIADWDGVANTSSPYVPSGDWPDHQRLKQYEGEVTETYGGTAIEIDKDYGDSLVVGNAVPAVTSVSPESGAVGSSVTIRGRAFVAGHTTVEFGGVPAAVVAVSSSGQLTAQVPDRSIQTVAVTVTTSGGTGATTVADQFSYIPIVGTAADTSTGGYWMTTSRGGVDEFHAPWDGSTSTLTIPSPVVAVAADPKTGGYWLVTAKGNIYNFHAPWYGSTAQQVLPAPIVGMADDVLTGGYWLVTSQGTIYNFDAPDYGSVPSGSVPPGSSVTGIAGDASTGGYWTVTSTAHVEAFHAPWYGPKPGRMSTASITGIAADAATGGYWLVSAAGGVYNVHARWDGSERTATLLAPVNSITASATGYVLSTPTGNIYNFDAPFYGSPAG